MRTFGWPGLAVLALIISAATYGIVALRPESGLPLPLRGGKAPAHERERADPVDLHRALNAVVAAGSHGVIAEVRDRGDGSGDGDVWQGTAGLADETTGRPPTANMHFRVGSLSKTFVAATALQLVAEGRLGLDDPVEKYLPRQVAGGRRITVRMLMNHTSGVYNFPLAMPSVLRKGERTRAYRPSTLVKVARLKGRPTFAPGSDAEYSNTNFVLVSMIIERVTGNRYDHEVRRRIIEPLGLTETSIPMTPAMPRPVMHAYLAGGPGRPIMDVTEFNPTRWYGTAQVVSTVSDINTFYDALLSGKVLKPAQLEEMRRVVPDRDLGTDKGWGLGIFRTRLSCGKVIWWHSGNIPGYRTWAMRDEDGQRSVALFQAVSAADATIPAQAFAFRVFCGVPSGTANG
ncbi:MAG: serine hydrolase [Streptosporangiales bacterium]|nr:serine hydrolase [Streptosporangiales bacterium]